MSAELFNAYAKEYDAWFNTNLFAYQSELESLKRVVPESGKGLEIGVGTGRFALPLNVFVGLDPSMNMLKVAQSRGIKVVLGYGQNLPFRVEEFDWVLINTTLCFGEKPGEILKEAKRTIKRGGRGIIGMIDKKGPLGRYYEKRESTFYRHADFQSADDVVESLRTLAFKDFRFYQTIFGPPGEINAIHNSKEGYGEGGFVAIQGRRA